MSKYHRILDCPDYEEINNDLRDYVVKYTTLLTPPESMDSYQYANFPDRFGKSITHFVQQNPKLIKYFKSLDLVLRDAYFTLAWKTTSPGYPESSCPIHLDKPPVGWKLNWPIFNMERTCVRFYCPNDPDVDINTLVTRAGYPDSKDRDRYDLKYKDFYEVERHDFAKNQPIIMYGQVGHDIGFYPDPVFPRIGLQGMFFKEPTHLL